MTTTEELINHSEFVPDDLSLLLSTLPPPLQEAVKKLPTESLLEIVMDLGRKPAARFLHEAVRLLDRSVTREDLDHVLGKVGEFTEDNRAGIERTLHRISALRNRKGEVVGLTLRVGRALHGACELIHDLIETGDSILLVGRPGVGKTTVLRDTARILSDELGKWVMVVDTSNEIAGDGDVPHHGIGSARRLQVPHPELQHAVMIEAVENHMPEVVVVDEIGTQAEAYAARTIAERGVQLIGTAHGNTLENLVANPTLSDLVGGVQTVTLSDEVARFRGTQKTISERKASPTFDIVVEMASYNEVVVHRDTASAVDALLRGLDPGGEARSKSPDGGIEVDEAASAPPLEMRVVQSGLTELPERGATARIYGYALSRDSLERVIRDLGVNARVVGHPEKANLILALRSRAHDGRLERIIAETGAPVHFVKRNSTAQLRRLLQNIFRIVGGIEQDEVDDAVREAEEAVKRVMAEKGAVELKPRRSALRKLQHQVISQHNLIAQSVGKEPLRRLVVFQDK